MRTPVSFMVVSKEDGLAAAFPALAIDRYTDKSALAKAVVTRAKANRQQRFFFHGPV
ncbi:4-alpha-L-fucosyltransferase [Kluyvera cryocrescens]|uniref:4-alpha-L-fucosyltransferase n=1 Tax=Kluyvera cryocrescens TaxID=580 RepID=A0A485BAG0_KLUCR|nr:4-alpha-L-fucosyltransferase [Kluyvera cryocrescens]